MKRSFFIHEKFTLWCLGRLANKNIWKTSLAHFHRVTGQLMAMFRTNLGLDVCAFNWILSTGHSANKLIFTVERAVLETQCVSHTNEHAESPETGIQWDDMGAILYLTQRSPGSGSTKIDFRLVRGEEVEDMWKMKIQANTLASSILNILKFLKGQYCLDNSLLVNYV